MHLVVSAAAIAVIATSAAGSAKHALHLLEAHALNDDDARACYHGVEEPLDEKEEASDEVLKCQWMSYRSPVMPRWMGWGSGEDVILFGLHGCWRTIPPQHIMAQPPSTIRISYEHEFSNATRESVSIRSRSPARRFLCMTVPVRSPCGTCVRDERFESSTNPEISPLGRPPTRHSSILAISRKQTDEEQKLIPVRCSRSYRQHSETPSLCSSTCSGRSPVRRSSPHRRCGPS